MEKAVKKPQLITKLETEADVRKWFKELLNVHNVSFHVDDSFEDIVSHETGQAFFSKKESKRLDKLMEKAVEICLPKGEDRVYEIGMQEMKRRFKMNPKRVKKA
jgi:hypothetical protein